MENGNVVYAANRFPKREAQNEPRQPDAFMRLKEETRTSVSDREKLANSMAKLAKRIDPVSPRKAALQMLRAAWDEDGSKKTGRFFDFGKERKNAVYESSGASWGKLIEVATKLLHPDDTRQNQNGLVERERNHEIKSLLRGTSFLPINGEAGPTPKQASDLLARLGEKIIDRVRRNTRLSELWEVLNQSPFAVCRLEEGEPDFGGPLREAAALADLLDSQFSDGGHASQRFVAHDSRKGDGQPETLAALRAEVAASAAMTGFHWAHPSLLIGLMVAEKDVDVFILPERFRAMFDRETRGGSGRHKISSKWQRMYETFMAWIEQESGKWGALPSTRYSEALGYGWMTERRALMRPVWLSICGMESEIPELRVTVGADDWVFDQLPLFWKDKSLEATLQLLDINPANYPWDDDFAIWGGFMVSETEDFSGETYGNYVLPDRIRALVPENYAKFSYVRLLEQMWDEMDHEMNGSGPLDRNDDEWLNRVLFTNRSWHFLPAFQVSEDVPAPAPARSLAAALLANIEAEPAHRLITVFENKAKVIAEAGLGFHAARIAHFAEAVERL